jgi:hypothetical protein
MSEGDLRRCVRERFNFNLLHLLAVGHAVIITDKD